MSFGMEKNFIKTCHITWILIAFQKLENIVIFKSFIIIKLVVGRKFNLMDYTFVSNQLS